jgi:LMBR1 domain-containing protein 1
MDVFMLVMTIILAVLLLIVNIYLLAYYCHPDDRGFGNALICKLVVIIGMTLAWAQVLMLPLDVSNSRDFGGGIRMDLFWIIIYLCTAVFIFFIIPALTYYYEADPEWSMWEKIKYSFWYFLATVVVILLILLVSYAFLSTAEIPITTVNCSIALVQVSNYHQVNTSNCSTLASTLNIDVSFPIYVIGFMSFISWFLFVIFGGIGLPALPLDFIYDFCTRPIKMSKTQLETFKSSVITRADAIKEIAEECKTLEKEGVEKKGCISLLI